VANLSVRPEIRYQRPASLLIPLVSRDGAFDREDQKHKENDMDLRTLFENSRHVQELQAGATLFVEGTPGDMVYVIMDGEVQVLVRNKLIDVLGPGEIVGEMALIDTTVRSATAIAKSACRLAVMDEQRFLYMVQETPFFALHVMRVLVQRLRRSMGVAGG
jgi:CRP/FNR family cyclic AMP-dependent transcriptional regulator